jgi:hypothetical protein
MIVFYDSVVPDSAFDLIISPSASSIVAINNMAVEYSVNSLTIT